MVMDAWYQLWMEQSHILFKTHDEQLKALFTTDAVVNPEVHLPQIYAWFEALKRHWYGLNKNDGAQRYQAYWHMVATMYQEATEAMLSEWTNRANSKYPLNNFHDLHKLWLNACQGVYQQILQTKTYQELAPHIMQAAKLYWPEKVMNEDELK